MDCGSGRAREGRAVKKKVTQEDLARYCKIDQGSVSRILNKDTRDSFSRETVERVFKAARELGYLHPALVSSNRRESLRKKATVEADLSIVLPGGQVHSTGQAEVDEISASGLLLRRIRTSANGLPFEPVTIDLTVTSSKLKGFRAKTQPARVIDRDGFGLAVQFRHDGLDEDSKEKLRTYLK